MDNLHLAGVLEREMPVAFEPMTLDGGARAGLIIVDEINGFATVGAGSMAPPVENPQVTRMVVETDRLARGFVERNWPVLAFLDSHESGKAEPPYPMHCVRGSGEDELVPALKWLEGAPTVTLVRKDCINGFVGSIGANGRNAVVDWVNENRLETLLVVGICTDICVMDFVLTMLSARNHGMVPTCRDVAVYEPGCATYDMTKAAAAAQGLPETASHPQEPTHHMGLYFMAARGARMIDRIAFGA